jgi:hypothetical protein
MVWEPYYDPLCRNIHGFEAWKFQKACFAMETAKTLNLTQTNHRYQFPTSKSTWKPNFAKSEDFCIWRPFCTLVTMATAAILNFSNLPHTTVDSPETSQEC